MSAGATLRRDGGGLPRLAARGSLTAYLSGLADSVGAENYMLLTVAYREGRGDARIIASNWIFDAIDLAGGALLARIATGPLSARPGMRPTGLDCVQTQEDDPIDGEESRFLHVSGHGEIFSLKLHVGRRRLFLLLSSPEPGAIDTEKLGRAQIECCYALSETPELIATESAEAFLTDRERECLIWVCEGKTTDEVAVIVGVSDNTVNNYLTSAIHKLSAGNRTMAVATAIRAGVI